MLAQGFGPDGLGALTISGIPGYVEMRQRLLPLAQQLAVSALPCLSPCTLSPVSPSPDPLLPTSRAAHAPTAPPSYEPSYPFMCRRSQRR
jgi:hypothetical protein